jgi:hypothetical protein
MKITIESTSRMVEISNEAGTSRFPARVWEGATESGIKVQCLVTRIAANAGENLEEFEQQLSECRARSVEVEAFPLRMIL